MAKNMKTDGDPLSELATACEASYAFPPLKAGLWQTILQAILSAVTGGCKPASKAEAGEMPRKWLRKVAKNGVAGCCPKNVRKALAAAGVTNATLQDRAFFTAVTAGAHNADAVQRAVAAAG